MTFLQLRNLVLYWLDDLNAGYFTPEQVNVWLNNAQYEVQKLLLQAGENYYIECAQTSLVINQAEYVLPDDFMKLHRLECILSGTPPNENKVPVAFVTLNQQDLLPTQTGQPGFYTIKRNRLIVFPTPDSNYTLRMNYSPRVTQMILDTDIPNVPEHYQEYIAVLATRDGILKDGREMGPITEKLAYYEKMLKDDADERNQDAPRSVVMTGQGVGYQFGIY